MVTISFLIVLGMLTFPLNQLESVAAQLIQWGSCKTQTRPIKNFSIMDSSHHPNQWVWGNFASMMDCTLLLGDLSFYQLNEILVNFWSITSLAVYTSNFSLLNLSGYIYKLLNMPSGPSLHRDFVPVTWGVVLVLHGTNRTSAQTLTWSSQDNHSQI